VLCIGNVLSPMERIQLIRGEDAGPTQSTRMGGMRTCGVGNAPRRVALNQEQNFRI
jgi:hypothetical protein